MDITAHAARTFGEVLTPSWVVQKMLMPLDIMFSPANRVLDLCAGPGAFIHEILHQRLQSAHTVGEVYTVLENLYAFELQGVHVLTMRARLQATVAAHAAKHGFNLNMVRVVNIITANVMMLDVLAMREIPVAHWDGMNDTPTWQPLTAGFFDTIVSNPPYQRNIARLGDRNQSKSTPLYHLFYDWARMQAPKQMAFIIPAKWYTGGWGLDAWRQNILVENRISILHDYRDSRAIFPTAEVNGGICWLVWRADHTGPTRVVRHDREGTQVSDITRPLLESGANFFVRREEAVGILRRVGSFQLPTEETFTDMILGTTPFGLASNFTAYHLDRTAPDDVLLYYIKEREFWVQPGQVTHNRSMVDSWKIFLPLCHNQHSKRITGPPRIYGPGTVCTHSYLAIIGFADQAAATSCATYMRTRFFRFLAHQLKISPIATRQSYRLIPKQSWDRTWTDEMLYVKYGLSNAEIAYIEDVIDPL